MTTTTPTIELKDKLADIFATEHQHFWGAESKVITAKRQEAIECFKEKGIPGRKEEAYKYTYIKGHLKKDFGLTSATENIAPNVIDELAVFDDAIRLVMINGTYVAGLSNVAGLPEGIVISSLGEAITSHKEIVEEHFAKYATADSDPYIALNTAFAANGLFIHLAKNTRIEKPVEIIHIGTATANSIDQPRSLIIAEEGSSINITSFFETVDLPVKLFTNALTELVIRENAQVDYQTIQNECENGFQLNTLQVSQAKNSVFSTHTITLNGELVRNNLNITLDDENCETHLYGLYMPHDKQHVDNHTFVDHRKPNCMSNELYKGIIADKATGVFNGKVHVRQYAQKTNAFQSNKNMLLSNDATIDSKPELEIYADDVKCSHGSSTGRMDEEAMFYLQARGIGEEGAKRLLLEAFSGEVIETIKNELLRDYINEKIVQRLAKK